MAQAADPDARVWRGSTNQQVIKVLGAPLGHPDFASVTTCCRGRTSCPLGANPIFGRFAVCILVALALRFSTSHLFAARGASCPSQTVR